MHPRIWLSPPHMGGSEQLFVNQAFESNWIAPVGDLIDDFEKDLRFYLGNNRELVALNSATSAIHLALILLEIKKGDTVICQTKTHNASANPITYVGAKPVFVDSEPETWNMSPALLKEAIEDGLKNNKKPKAIIIVHLYGMPAKMDEITTISRQYDIPLIEDSAEALGSEYKGQKCGTFGHFGILSFNGNKIITTSGGGTLVCHTQADRDKTIFLSTQARDKAPHYQHSEIGYNYRMSNVIAGIGRGQMEVLPERVLQRRANFDFYKEAFKNDTVLEFVPEPNGHYSNRWLTTVLTDSYEKREQIRLTLEKENIETRPLWKPMHLQPVFNGCKSFVNGVSQDLFNRGLCLPSGSSLTIEEKYRIVSKIKEILQ